MERQALSLRVGADTGSGGFLGTVNFNFEFDWRNIPGHNDPKWDELSYGDWKFENLRRRKSWEKGINRYDNWRDNHIIGGRQSLINFIKEKNWFRWNQRRS